MKTSKFSIAVLALIVAVILSSCELDGLDQHEDNSILPERFMVDIPQSLSNNQPRSGFHKSASSADTLNGNEIYKHLNTFIAIGEGAALITQSVIWHIALYKIDQVVELTYVSEDDNRTKHLVVESNVNFDNKEWEYQLTITDLESEGNEDGGIGMQVFWNKNPIEGIALIKPRNLNLKDNSSESEAMFSIEYSEKGMGEYETYMIVGIADLPLPAPIFAPYAMNSLKMFVGKKGDIIDVYGSSNHPNAHFFTDKSGFNWSFVASGNEEKDIAVAEVALPPSDLDENDRNILLKDYSIKNVLTAEINDWFFNTFGIHPDSSDVADYLTNTEAPGYFESVGFIQGGIAPSDEYKVYEERLEALSPYNPITISNLDINFK